MIASIVAVALLATQAAPSREDQQPHPIHSAVDAAAPTVASPPDEATDAARAVGEPAVPGHWKIDPSSSQVSFNVHTRWLAEMGGRFEMFEGRIDSLPSGELEVRLTMQAASAEFPGHARSTGWIRSPLFFDAARHPRIRFVSAHLPASRLASGGIIDGVLEMHGVSAPIRFVMEPPTCTNAGEDCPLRASGQVSRQVFGMSGMKMLVRDQVEFVLSIRLRAST